MGFIMGVRLDGILQKDHEQLTHLLGGGTTGHYHVTSGQNVIISGGIGLLDGGSSTTTAAQFSPAIDAANSVGHAIDGGSPSSVYILV